MPRGYHDIGGDIAGPIPKVNLPWLHWEKQVEAIRNLLGDGTRRVLSLDELRRGFESFGLPRYQALSFYRRRLEAMTDILVEKDVLNRDEYDIEAANVRERWAAADSTPFPAANDEHAHEHLALVVEDEAGNLAGQVLVDALQNMLVEQGLLTRAEVTREIEKIEAPSVHLGARIIARAWSDAAYKDRLLENGKNGAAELRIAVGEAQLIVVENTPTVHNLVCCTLCSCYPRSILGQPPSWYISKAYRARAVREPRAVLAEFGLLLPATIQLVVHDSNADMRYLVLPQRPSDTKGWAEDKLASLVSRDAMIGVAR
jgi:Nitrile hydratase, alpha chain/Nitrile hydratase beta subunit